MGRRMFLTGQGAVRFMNRRLIIYQGTITDEITLGDETYDIVRNSYNWYDLSGITALSFSSSSYSLKVWIIGGSLLRSVNASSSTSLTYLWLDFGADTCLATCSFQYCTALTDVDLIRMNNGSFVDGYCFRGCTALTSFRMADTCVVPNFYSWFLSCTSLETFSFPSEMDYEVDLSSTFVNCSSLASVVNSDKIVNALMTSAFVSCSSLTELDLSSWTTTSTTTGLVFNYCSSLVTLDLRSLASDIPSCSFTSCDALTTVYVSASNSSLTWAVISAVDDEGWTTDIEALSGDSSVNVITITH